MRKVLVLLIGSHASHALKTCQSVLLLITMVLVPQVSAAEELNHLLGKGTEEIGIATGHGWSFDSPKTVKTVPFNIHWGYVFSNRMGSSWYQGNWEVLVEGSFNYLYHNRNQYGIGIAGLVRYNFLNESAWVPFVQGGVGAWHSNIDIHNFPNDFNFSPQAGIGIQYFTCRCMSIKAEYRVQHFSNAGLKSDNPGMNFHNVLVGISWYY